LCFRDAREGLAEKKVLYEEGSKKGCKEGTLE
jgi:hypothetical protein